MVVELVKFVFDDSHQGILFGLDAAGNPYGLRIAADGTIRPVNLAMARVEKLDALQRKAK